MEKIVKLRNPWGKGEWKGKWSDNDRSWTPQLKAELKHSCKDDGIFFMPFEEFEKLYSDFQMCYYHNNYEYASFRLETQKNETVWFQFDIQKPGEYYFTINQINRRFFPKKQGYAYSNCSLGVYRQDPSGKGCYVGAIQKPDKEAWFKASCQPGRYYACVFTPWKSCTNQITMSTYGPQMLQLTKISASQISPQFMAGVLGDKAKKSNDGWRDWASQGQRDIRYKFENGSDGLAYFYFQNNTPNVTANVTINFSMLDKMEIQPPYTGQSKPQIRVPPNGDNCLWLRSFDQLSKMGFSIMVKFEGGSSGGHGSYGRRY